LIPDAFGRNPWLCLRLRRRRPLYPTCPALKSGFSFCFSRLSVFHGLFSRSRAQQTNKTSLIHNILLQKDFNLQDPEKGPYYRKHLTRRQIEHKQAATKTIGKMAPRRLISFPRLLLYRFIPCRTANRVQSTGISGN